MTLSPAESRFEIRRKLAGSVLAPIGFAITYTLVAGSIEPEGRTLAAILVAVGILWVTETLPLPVTALLGAALCVALGVAPAKQVLAYFADPIVFVFLGSFMLARAMTIHQLDRRIALGFLSIPWIARHPARVLGGLGLVTALLSMWVSNTATTAMMLPIALGVLGAMHGSEEPIDPRSWPFATGVMLMIAYAASIGGIGTPVGSPPNLIGIGLIRNAAGFEISFFRWMALCIPLFAVMMIALLLLLYRLHPERRPYQRQGRASMADYLARERGRLGPWSAGQINTLVAFAVAVALWITPGVLALPVWGPEFGAAGKWLNTHVPESIAAVIGAILLFVLPISLREGRFTMTWEDAVKIDWGTILLFGGGLALGMLMIDTGVAKLLGDTLTQRLGADSLWMLTGLSIALGIALSEATSNTAASNMIIPVVIGICQTSGISPVPPALGACLGASYGFMLPVSTPPNAIVYGSGLVSIHSMIRAGLIFDVLGFCIIWGGLRVLCPVLGLM